MKVPFQQVQTSLHFLVHRSVAEILQKPLKDDIKTRSGLTSGSVRYLIWRGFVICLVRGSLQMVIFIVVCHQLHPVLSLKIQNSKHEEKKEQQNKRKKAQESDLSDEVTLLRLNVGFKL